MPFLCDNLRGQKIIFEYKLRHLLARVRYVQKIHILIEKKNDKNMPSKFIYLDFCEEMQVYCTIDRNPLAAQIEKP